MKKWMRLAAAALGLALGLALLLPACAARRGEDTGAPAAPMQIPAGMAGLSAGFSDVDSGAWYAGAVDYVREHGLMEGVGEGRFDPEGSLTRAMLVTVLWRQTGQPVVNYLMRFSDVDGGQWYTEAIRWAAGNRLVGGYGNGLFGTGDPITQEHLSLILQRITDEPVTDGIPGFDGSSRPATRAQAAAAVMNCGTLGADPQANRILVAYFSATGSTRGVAEHIADIVGADLFEIAPEEPYTGADLDYRDASSRASREQDDPAARPAIHGEVEDMGQYGVVFLGYPIWHGQAPKIISTFLEGCDLSGKTVIPFCTSGGSGIDGSEGALNALAPQARWRSGERFGAGASREAVKDWVDGLELGATGPMEGEDGMLNIAVNKTVLTAALADNSSARALAELLADGPLSVEMRDYNRMEKVGPLGADLPANDEWIDAQAGDLILYQGNQLVIYYGVNSWSLTRLGRIEGVGAGELRDILGGGDVRVTLSMG
jgi:flavodoxin